LPVIKHSLQLAYVFDCLVFLSVSWQQAIH